MGYVLNGPVPWPVPPDWKNGVRESLNWLTDRMVAKRTGNSEKRMLRADPRRMFTFDVIADGQDRRLLETLAFDRGVAAYELPIWHDVQLLGGVLGAGTDTILCDTTGYEFEAGGRAMLWRSANEFEIFDIDTVEPGHLIVDGSLAQSWDKGTRLYPIKRARLVTPAEERAFHDRAGTRQVTMVLDEPSSWAAVSPPTTYRGYPVLEQVTDYGNAPSTSFSRNVEAVDVGVGPIAYIDLVGAAQRGQDHQVIMGNRAEHAAYRSFLYFLRGRFSTFWLPTNNEDLHLVEAIAGDRDELAVEWLGYTLFGRMQSNWRDVRIHLFDGTSYYRRIVGSVVDGAKERLALDTPLPVDIALGQVSRICFMALSESANDAFELEHVTDAAGVTKAALNFQAVVHAV